MSEIRGLTVRPPWAQAIAHGGKTVENRTWRTCYQGLVAIHAGKRPDWDAAPPAWTAVGMAPYQRGARRADWATGLAPGMVIAVAVLDGCHSGQGCELENGREMCSPWAMHRAWHWQLRDVRPLAEPVPCTGARGLWPLPEDVGGVIREQLRPEASRA